MEYVFVYGTLKSGHPACGMMERHGSLVCQAEANGTLVSLGGFPGYYRNGSGSVKGELWSVGASAFTDLDRYEGEGSLYDRVRISVKTESGVFSDVHVYEYRGMLEPEQVIESGEWKSFF